MQHYLHNSRYDIYIECNFKVISRKTIVLNPKMTKLHKFIILKIQNQMKTMQVCYKTIANWKISQNLMYSIVTRGFFLSKYPIQIKTFCILKCT